jgi:hypothetical protein
MARRTEIFGHDQRAESARELESAVIRIASGRRGAAGD